MLKEEFWKEFIKKTIKTSKPSSLTNKTNLIQPWHSILGAKKKFNHIFFSYVNVIIACDYDKCIQ